MTVRHSEDAVAEDESVESLPATTLDPNLPEAQDRPL